MLILDPVLVDDPEQVRTLTREPAGVRVLLLGNATDAEWNIRLLAAGASGFVDQTSSAGTVAHAVAAVAGGLGLAPTRYIQLAAERLATSFDHWRGILSEGELALWQDIAEGQDYAEIAERHFVSERTARRRVDALLERLELDNRMQAAELAGRIFLRDHPVQPPADDGA